jgi:hypothetical protein
MAKPDRHRQPPIPFRPPEADRAWLVEYAERASRAVNAVLAEALAEYRRRREQEQQVRQEP